MQVLVCGGAGYIGSHACVALAAAGHRVVLFDSFVTSSPDVVRRIEAVTGVAMPVVRGDVRDRAAVRRVLVDEGIDAVVHFAALKAVSESFDRSIDYFDVNIGGTISLLGAMAEAGVDRLVFSSSATVYGQPDHSPVQEDAELRPNNPYAVTKAVAERLITEIVERRPGFAAATLRYFNPAGAHPSGLLGEAPTDVPGNLFPYLCEVAVGRRPHLRIFGDDWPTPDGTGVRDYVHVMDLARAHAMALDQLAGDGRSFTVNLGAGRGASVLDVVRAFEAASGRTIPCRVVDRRAGDLAELLADPGKAAGLLGWRAEHGLEEICRDAWAWQSRHPGGFGA